MLCSSLMPSLEENCFDSVPSKLSNKVTESPRWPSQDLQTSDSCHNIRLTVPQNIVNKMEKSPSQLNNWNPMKDEFNDDKFNSYETGLPGNMSAKKGNQEYDRLVRHTGFQFYVSGIPKQMTQEGLTNLFSRAGKVVSCKICKSDRQDTETTFGFVGMSTVSELSKAHTQLNNYQVGSQTLKLRVARDTEMYLKNEGSDNAFHFSGGESQSSSRSPRRMDNRYGSREMSSSDRSDVDHAREETKRDAQPNLKKTFSFKSQGAMLIQVRVESNQRKVRMSDKPLVLKTDNAQFSGTLNDTVVNVHSTGLNLGELEAEDLKNVSAQIQRSRHSSLDQKEVQPSENVSVVDTSVSKGQQEVVSKSQHFDGAGTTTIAPCLNCGRPGMRCCSACKSKYCTQACQQKHWPSHKLHCKSIQARLEAFGGFAKKDSYIYLKDLDYFQPEKQELQALAIHLVSPDEIWIQLMQTKSKEYFSLICSMTDIYNAMDNSSPYKPKVGTLCAATTDEEWYRGTILEIKEDNIVSVRLIDYGDIRDIHPKDLRHLTQQFSKTPILASPCKLVDIEPIDGKWSTEACDYLVSMLVNKQCKVNLKKIENGIYPATITMTQGKEEICVEKKLIDAKFAQPKQSRHTVLPSVMEKISTGDKLDVVVTSVESVSAIFATLSENGLALMELQDALMNRYSILPSNQTYSPQVGEICATKFVDNYWYRGRILAVNGSKVKVLYVDYGNQEVISVTDCHPLSKYLLKLDEQLVTCSLANSRGKDVMKSVKDLEETRIKIQVSGKVNGILMIELLTGDNTKTESKSPLLPTPSQDSPTKFQEKSSPVMRQGYSNTTPQERSPSSSNQDSYRQRSTYNNRSPMNGDVKSPENYGNQEQRGKNSYRNDGKTSTYNGYQHQPSNFQKFNNQNIPPSPVMAEKCEMMSLKEGKIETAMIYVANGPSSFYVQVNQPTSVRAIQQISDPMSEDYSNIKEVHLPVVGELCIAKFSDDYWYRAEVLSIGTNKLNVKFIDYGNIDPVKKEDVRRIKEPYSKIPVVAIHCALHGAPITDNPKDKQSQEFAEKFVNKVVGVKRVGITPKGVSLVEIFDKKGSNRPINADYIVPVQSPKQVDKNVPTVVFRELELQCETKATVMYVVSPSEFYCTRVEGDVPTTVESTKYVTNDPLDARSEPKTLIISDSIVRDFDEDILENTKVVCLRGRRVIDIKHHLDEAPVHEFSTVIIHGSTNDCTTEADEKFAEGVYDEIFDDLKRRAPDLTIAFSTVCPRFDDGSFQAHVNKLNYKLRELSVQSGCIQINNDVNFLLNDGTVDRSTLDRRGLHLSRVGSLRLLKNINDKHRIIRDKKETQNVQCSNPISDILALKNLMESLNIRYANKGKNYDYVPRKGEMCCSIFAEDQSWYRALVLDVNVDNQCASVQYVDYGNKAKVAFDSVHPLDKEFSTTPCLAIKCCLAGTRPDQGSAWSEGAIERVKDVLGQGEKLLHIKLMSHDDGWNYIEVADPTTNEVLNKVFQNASPVTGIHDTPLSSHRPAFLPSPSTDTDALLLEKYEQKKRELEELQNMLQKH